MIPLGHWKRSSLLEAALIAVVFGGLAAASLGGALKPVDTWLSDLRFNAAPRAPTNSTIFVDIDSASLADVGVWPWPRSIHASILDRLMELGASEVVFDVDFSAASNAEQDQILARALENAGGYAYLAAFQQAQSAPEFAQFNLPLPMFLLHAPPVGVNVRVDEQGMARSYPYALNFGSELVPSLATVLAGQESTSTDDFGIDFSIDTTTIDRISATDLINDRVDPARVVGKQAVVGASAVELRDLFAVPGQGVIPGALLQILAAETLKQSRVLQTLPPWPGILGCLAIGLFALFGRRVLPIAFAIGIPAVLSVAVETAAVLAQVNFALVVNTALIHATFGAFGLSVLVSEVISRGVERRRAYERLRYLSTHDPLTGAFNRISFIEQARSFSNVDFAVVLIDLRRFRIINDTLGHEQGDILLKQVVARLASMAPDIVARLGGDSFAILVPEADADRLAGYCGALTELLSLPYELVGGHQASIAASAGATTTNRSGRDPNILLSHADMALSVAKEMRGSAVKLFETDMSERLVETKQMDAALRAAVLERRFTLAYQPQVEISTGKVVGAEALARWSDPKLGHVSPVQFIPAAEETGLIVEIGRWALETACHEAASWPDHMTIAVNVSAVQFELSDVVNDIRSALTKSGLAPERLEIEITEGVFVRDVEAVRSLLGQLRALGVRIALDDFGTGYSSLSYLGALPIDKIKVDQSFVRKLPMEPQAVAIAQAVIAISKALNKTVIAEGVEDQQQATMLDALGCHLAQGYFYGRPVSAEDFARRFAVLPLDSVA
ncbi:MAG: EAL domain-containing protein [Devosia sp.]